MKVEIDKSTQIMLKECGKHILYDISNNTILQIIDFFIEEHKVVKKNIFGVKRTRTKYILTDINIKFYDKKGKFTTLFDYHTCISLVKNADLYQFKQSWITIKEQLLAFGIILP